MSGLINLSRRYLRRGYSGSRFVLRMTRDDIGTISASSSRRERVLGSDR